MKKKLPFEEALEQQVDNLPSWHEDEAWQKMKNLLDDNDKRRPAAFLRFCVISGLLILLFLTGTWLFVPSKNLFKQKQGEILDKPAAVQQKKVIPYSSKTINKTRSSKLTVGEGSPEKINSQKNSLITTDVLFKNNKISPYKNTKQSENSNRVAKATFKLKKKDQNKLLLNKPIITNKSATVTKSNVFLPKKNINNTAQTISIQQKNDSVGATALRPANSSQTVIIPQMDTLFGKKDTAAKENRAQPITAFHRLKKYVVSAGVGLQQQIPVAGQQIVYYQYNGHSAFSDYIPSVYLRFEREKKWFLQTEFIYGAPQLLKEFAYSRQTRADSAGTVTTTTLRLKKASYHDIPVSFNYYLHPNLSAGAGFSYSIFHNAVAEKEINTHNFPNTEDVSVQQIAPITGYTDSFFYRSHTNLMLQADYQWRKLSLSLRYTKDLQPFIKYTLPDGTIATQKNSSLQFIVRYRLWKSKRF